MLTLTLLRHAKAVQYGYDDDFTRSLTDKGKADAVRLGTYLADKRKLPDLALVSAAARTTLTFEIVDVLAHGRIPVRFEESLYNATAGQIRDALKLIEPSVRHLMIVGHNPGIMEATILLARDGDIRDLQRLRNRFPPGALARLSFNTTDWLDARASGGRLELLLLPEDVAAPD